MANSYMGIDREACEEILGRKIKLGESISVVHEEVRLKLQTILNRTIHPHERVNDVMREYRNYLTYTLYLNGKFYGTGDGSHIKSLFDDYVRVMDMYKKDSVIFEVRRGLPRGEE